MDRTFKALSLILSYPSNELQVAMPEISAVLLSDTRMTTVCRRALSPLLDQLAEADGVDWYPDEIEIVRFGLNYDFIEENNLSWINNLETSSGARLDSPRHKDHRKPYVQNYLAKYGARKVEANALVTRPDAGRQLMSDTLEKYIDEDASDEFDYRMSSLREELEEHIVEMMQEKFGDVEA